MASIPSATTLATLNNNVAIDKRFQFDQTKAAVTYQCLNPNCKKAVECTNKISGSCCGVWTDSDGSIRRNCLTPPITGANTINQKWQIPNADKISYAAAPTYTALTDLPIC